MGRLSLPPPAPSGGGAKNRTVAQPPPRGAPEVPKLVEFSLGDSVLDARRGGLRRQGGSCCSPGAWEDWGLNQRSPAVEPKAGWGGAGGPVVSLVCGSKACGFGSAALEPRRT